MLLDTSLFVRRGDRDAVELRDALAECVSAWVMRARDLVRVDPREHADRHASIGPMGPLPWVAPWLRFTSDDAYGEGALELARWVSGRLATEVVVLLRYEERSQEEDVDDRLRFEQTLFRDGHLVEGAGKPDVEALGLDLPADSGTMLLGFRARSEIRYVSGPPALADLHTVFVDDARVLALSPREFRRLRLGAVSVGGASAGVRIHASGSALDGRLLVAVKATWDSEDATVSGSDDEAPFVTRDAGTGVVAPLPRARLRRARTDGVRLWTWNDAASGDLRRHSSSSVYTDVDLVAGPRTGNGDLTIRIEPDGATATECVSLKLRVVRRSHPPWTNLHTLASAEPFAASVQPQFETLQT